jgi:hypothetical protein
MRRFLAMALVNQFNMADIPNNFFPPQTGGPSGAGSGGITVVGNGGVGAGALPPGNTIWRPMPPDTVQPVVTGFLGAPQGAGQSAPQGTQSPLGGLAQAFQQGGFGGVMNSIIGALNNIITGIGNQVGEQNAEGSASQFVKNATFSSTGDPHLAETGTVSTTGNTQSVNSHFDSMTGHDNLISSQDFNGGYRVSTAVTQPNANGITLNASATVHTNNNQNNITMNNDGSVAITNNGQPVNLAPGQSTTLSAGEQVTRNTNGSLTVSEQNANGGSISTTMQTNGSGGVDVTTNVQNASVGGDIANQSAPAASSQQRTPSGRHAHQPPTPPIAPNRPITQIPLMIDYGKTEIA